jgi:hypothetical protein
MRTHQREQKDNPILITTPNVIHPSQSSGAAGLLATSQVLRCLNTHVWCTYILTTGLYSLEPEARNEGMHALTATSLAFF